jgi:pyruvate-ferredoxin/flavodoxin oxidoreductase
MDSFASLTGRHYKLFDYVGHPEAEHLIISMASSTETIETTINQLNEKGKKYGLIKVRLFRPFSTKHLVQALPKSVKSIAVLDRTKEPGSTGEPLYLDVLQSISEAFQNNRLSSFPKIVGGRYGLSSKEFTPSMVYAIFKNLKEDQPKNNFTIGINDDAKNLSLDFSEAIKIKNNLYEAVFYQEKTEHDSFSNTLKLIGKKENTFVQGYTQCDYKKSNSYNTAHLRIGNTPIKAPYLIEKADFIGCQNVNFSLNDNALNKLKFRGTLLINTSQTSKAFWQSLSVKNQKLINEKQINVFVVNIEELKANQILKDIKISEFHACFLAVKKGLFYDETIINLNDFIYKVNTSVESITTKKSVKVDNTFNESLLGKLLAKKGNDVPVSMLPVDGTYPTNTSQFNPIQNSTYLPNWNTDLCTQCGACSMACPQAALRIKVYDDAYLNDAPKTFKHIISEDFDLMNYTIQINPEQCNGCNNCVDACSVKALTLVNKNDKKDENKNWDYFKTIQEFNRTKIDVSKVSQQQLQEPFFKYSNFAGERAAR